MITGTARHRDVYHMHSVVKLEVPYALPSNHGKTTTVRNIKIENGVHVAHVSMKRCTREDELASEGEAEVEATRTGCVDALDQHQQKKYVSEAEPVCSPVHVVDRPK